MADAPVRALGLEPGRYLTLIARAEPENSILEVVTGFSAAPRGLKLVVLGNYQPGNAYHRAVKAAASDEVVFTGAIYDPTVVQALRFHSLAYVHGHQVGGTNPSLVEALGAGNPVLAHANPYNRWVAGDSASYFSSGAEFAQRLEELATNQSLQQERQQHSRARHAEAFTWQMILDQYEQLLARFLKSAD